MKTKFSPKVSIVIPVYNGSNYLKEAIDSALAQTYKNIEIIVINDGSNDKGKTDKICKSYGNKIRYFKKENGGVASALNMGIEKMEGEYFSWLSHDDVYYPNKVEEQVLVLRNLKNKKTILYSNVEYIDEKGNTINTTAYEQMYPEKKLNSGIFPVLKGLTNGCAILIPIVCFKESGVFDEELIASNDYEMWFRLFAKYPIKFVPKLLIKYRYHQEQGTKKIPQKQRTDESDKVWSSAISTLKDKDIKLFDEEPFRFYWNLAKQMEVDSRNESRLICSERAYRYFEKNGPEVSVIMPLYNSEKYVLEAIDSILSQSYPNFELIIVNDSSSDDSLSIVKKYQRKDFRVISVENKYSKGVAGAMNTGLDTSRANKYITRMDSDDISLDSRLEKQIMFLDQNIEYGFCTVNMAAFGDVENPMLFTRSAVPLEWLFLWSNPMASAATMYRANLIKRHHLRFRPYKVASDYDFLCQMLQHSKPFMLYDESLYRYRIYKKSIFQKNKQEVYANSIKINKELIKSLIGKEPPDFHKYLTEFNIDSDDKSDFKISEINKWVQELLQVGKRKWNWSDAEYLAAKRDSEERIKYGIVRYFKLFDIKKNLEWPNQYKEEYLLLKKREEVLLKEQWNLRERIKVLERELLSMENSRSWKITKPFRKIVHLFTLFKTQGIMNTLKNIGHKIRGSFCDKK